jgi:hypothetical protein
MSHSHFASYPHSCASDTGYNVTRITRRRKFVVTIGSSHVPVGGGITFEKEETSQRQVPIHLGIGGKDLTDVLDRTCSRRS